MRYATNIHHILENLIAKSEDFGDSSVWGLASVTVTPNNATAPDGTTTADKVVFAASETIISQTFPLISGNFTLSVYVKGTAGQTLFIGNGASANDIITLNGGWQCMKVTTNVYGAGRITVHTYGGVTARTVGLWGAQVNNGDLKVYLKKNINMKARLTNGQVEYFEQPPWLLGDATSYATVQGYKEEVFATGNGGNYETATSIIVETPAPEQPQKTVWSPLEFLSRFARPELRAIFTAAKTNIDVEIWKIMFDKAANIDLTDPLTVQGVAMLEQFNLIAVGRKEEILKPI